MKLFIVTVFIEACRKVVLETSPIRGIFFHSIEGGTYFLSIYPVCERFEERELPLEPVSALAWIPNDASEKFVDYIELMGPGKHDQFFDSHIASDTVEVSLRRRFISFAREKTLHHSVFVNSIDDAITAPSFSSRLPKTIIERTRLLVVQIPKIDKLLTDDMTCSKEGFCWYEDIQISVDGANLGRPPLCVVILTTCFNEKLID